ncbi:MAG: ATP synthase F0 subunit B [Nitrospinae bacterium RIFCSPLOWO2_12_FULL_47_7]|nr:MAG: ATP synthase F0 subunit B [Nitrospinae bacterium RIFCSPLOWO2_12_FULL_47_7]
MPQLEQTSVFASLIFWSLISFGLLFVLLKKYAFPPLLEILDEREKKIRGDIQSAEKLKSDAEKMQGEFEVHLKTAHEKSVAIVHMATTESKKIQERMLQETQAKIKQMQKDAEQEITAARSKLLGEIRSYTAALTIASTEKILKKVITDADRKRFVDESIEEVMKEIRHSNMVR